MKKLIPLLILLFFINNNSFAAGSGGDDGSGKLIGKLNEYQRAITVSYTHLTLPTKA